MSLSLRLASPLFVLALLGCTPNNPANADSGASGARASGGTGSAATGSAGAMKVAYIPDPTLNNMNAVSIKIPANWVLKGVLFQGGSCFPVPAAVYRATSPDGQSMGEQMPDMAWKWGTGPQIGTEPKNDCMPLKGPMSAQDFLKYFAPTLKVTYVGPDPVPEEENARAQQSLQDSEAEVAGQYAAHNMRPPKNTRELARAIVTFQKGAVAMKGRLDLTLDCVETNYPGQGRVEGRPPRIVTGPSSTVDKCLAKVRYYTAPASKFAAVMALWNPPGSGEARMEEPWKQAWIARNAEQTRQTIAMMSAQSRAFMQRQQQQFQHDQAVRQNMHDHFIQSMNEQGEINKQNFYDQQYAKDTATSDFVDYALDRRTVQDTDTGVIYKQPVTEPVDGPLQQVHGNGAPY
jgi:hypothetical protein